jgi:hypothetical protein
VIDTAEVDDVDLGDACSAALTEGAIDAIAAVQTAARSNLHDTRIAEAKADTSDGLLIFIMAGGRVSA